MTRSAALFFSSTKYARDDVDKWNPRYAPTSRQSRDSFHVFVFLSFAIIDARLAFDRIIFLAHTSKPSLSLQLHQASFSIHIHANANIRKYRSASAANKSVLCGNFHLKLSAVRIVQWTYHVNLHPNCSDLHNTERIFNHLFTRLLWWKLRQKSDNPSLTSILGFPRELFDSCGSLRDHTVRKLHTFWITS